MKDAPASGSATTTHHLHLHIGLRNLKTALSASLCALIYHFFLSERNPTFACIGAIFGLGANMDHSKLHGGNRLFGTIIGGLLGMGLFRIYLIFYPDGENRLLLVPLLFVGVINLILLAHNYSRHFGQIHTLEPGDTVCFTDADGTRFMYEVSLVEQLERTAIEEMESGDWDLTLFTCTVGGAARVTVRCQQTDDNAASR